MAMTYAELKTNVQDITEMSFTDAQLSMFTKQVEQRVYGIIKDLPILRKTLAGQSVSATAEYVLPADCLYVHSVVQQTSANRKAISERECQAQAVAIISAIIFVASVCL